MTSIEKETERLVESFVSKLKGIKCGNDYKIICDKTNNSEEDMKAKKLNITIQFFDMEGE
jgi:hypothetical protein